MANPFLAEIRVFPFNFPPRGWAMCDGQLMSIAQNTALFSLLGTTYGGDGQSNFALPNLQGQVAIHWGQGPGLSVYDLGQSCGEDTVTLLPVEMPGHSHSAMGVAAKGTTAVPTSGLWAEPAAARATISAYSDVVSGPQALNPQAIAASGGAAPHENRPPLLVMNFCIALQGIFPARN
jgi:microcystin-dependent protein